MIIDFFKYIWRGSLHYLNILFRLFDFKDLGFMWIILIGLLFISIFNKNVRQGVLSLAFQLINVVKTIPGFIFFCLFFSYYIYVLFFLKKK